MDSLGAVIGGMIGPLVAVAATWFAVRRAHRRDPAGVQRVMLGAFFAKFVFFGVYVVVMIKVFNFEAVPFVLSFAVSFLGLYALQAVMLARLFRQSAPEAR
jgi:F0F1-type ATP synthase assembly protein I